jgi:MarR family 2-MHQ and catechol resistance regulon transcriptional repressor
MGTHYKGTIEEVRALNTYIKLTRAVNTIEAELARSLAEVGLTVSQFGTLEALYHLGPLCQGEIGLKILKSSGNMTMVIDNLEKRGYVRRERDPDDRRQVIVSLTGEGEALMKGYFPEHLQVIVGLLNVISPGDQEQLAELCKTLGTAQPALEM